MAIDPGNNDSRMRRLVSQAAVRLPPLPSWVKKISKTLPTGLMHNPSKYTREKREWREGRRHASKNSHEGMPSGCIDVDLPFEKRNRRWAKIVYLYQFRLRTIPLR